MEVVRLAPDSVLIDGAVYKSVKTENGNYTPEVRREYMRHWRKKRKLSREIK